ncbi:hypothetical protein ACGFZA_01160 [Streptomyces sp. NPDC048211]|uniref:hypothetical protein n=1 Tax=Streptomyces sp. NPDC048211 TaxID=3365516 RepID=UPI0037213384
MVTAHRLCSPTHPERVRDRVLGRAQIWRGALGLALTVAAWLAIGLVPMNEIPGRVWQSFTYTAGSMLMVFNLCGIAVAWAPKGRKWAAAKMWRGPLLAYVLTCASWMVFFRTSLSDWPPNSPLSAVGGLWTGSFGLYGLLLLVLNGGRTADVNDSLPVLLPTFFMLCLTLPTLGDPMYDKVPMAVRLILGLTGPVTLVFLAYWQLRRLRVRHGVRFSDLSHGP